MTSPRYRVRNAASRPVEIHRGREVFVLEPGGFVDVDAKDQAIEALVRSGALTRHALPPQPSTVPEPPPAADDRGRKTARKRTKRVSRPPTP